MIIFAIVLVALIALGIYLTSKDGGNGVACPSCKTELDHIERVIRPTEDNRIVKVTDKFKCPRCGNAYARHALHEHRQYYTGIWHGGKEGWGVRPNTPSQQSRHVYFKNINNDGYHTNLDESLSEFYPIDLNKPEEPVVQEHPIAETSSITKKKITLFVIVLFVIILALCYYFEH